jgi:predicted O-linked N-acetylglucosamine transferase (SPINDLY family)
MDFPQLLAAAAELEAGGCAAEAADLYRTWLEGNASDMAHVGYFNLGALLAQMGDLPAAESAYRQAVQLLPGFVQPRLNLATVLERMGRVDEAIAEWRWVCQAVSPQSLSNKPLRCMALNQLGRVLEHLQRDEEALQCLTESLSLDAQQAGPLQHWIALRQKLCIWSVYAPFAQLSLADMEPSTSAMSMLALSDDPARQRAAAQGFVDRVLTPEQVSPPWSSGYRHARLRVAYLSSDWRAHPVAMLTVELLELHNRDKLEVFAYCWSPEDGSPLRQRLKTAFEHFERIENLDDATAAARIAAAGIDIVIDLHGLSAGVRPGILALKPAPITVTWLGFIGPTAMPWIDYVIGDRFTLTDELEPYFSERMIRLSGCFLPGDRKRQIGKTATRAECGLPENGFVFATFNNAYKLNPVMWDCWMRILRQVPDSVLWVVDDNEWATEHLRAAALAHGIDVNRLVFNPRTSHADFLGRLPLADLFLDNHPYNAGSTASDALWMGLPILTLSGRCFVSRMGGSILTAAGVPELITYHLPDYEQKAIALARNPAEHRALRDRVSRARQSPAFDMSRLAQEVEHCLLQIARPTLA